MQGSDVLYALQQGVADTPQRDFAGAAQAHPIASGPYLEVVCTISALTLKLCVPSGPLP